MIILFLFPALVSIFAPPIIKRQTPFFERLLFGEQITNEVMLKLPHRQFVFSIILDPEETTKDISHLKNGRYLFKIGRAPPNFDSDSLS